MKVLKNIIIIVVITLLTFSITMEIAYRNQWFDFYKSELIGLNTNDILKSDKRKILVCGDSFTADLTSYVQILRDSLTEYAVINTAVPGTGILQHHICIPERIHKYSPDIFIYQFYVGNDLFDITHPTNSDKISALRKIYWWLSDRMLSLAFINYRFAGLRYLFYDDGGGSYKPKLKEEFSVNNYSKREKLNYLADPSLFENTLFLKNGREKDFETFQHYFLELISNLKPGTKIYFVIIPHQSQLSKEYFNRHQQMGSNSSQPYYSYGADQLPLYRSINELCIKHKITLIDPLIAFRNFNESDNIYYENDPHLKNKGQRITGELIVAEIKALNNQPFHKNNNP